ncbi:MAG: hypothetical protein L0207_04900 [Chlamydiae bacterium]|nr:hypothetical protein [Chlamydiota bacterium]
MKKWIIPILFSFCFLSALRGNEKETPASNECKDIDDQYGYFSFSFGFPALFGLNIGYRSQHNHNGFEIGGGVVPLVFIYELHAYTSYLYYPKPSLDSQFYFGLGVRGGYANCMGNKWRRGAGYIAPGIILGKSYLNPKNDKRFFQVAVSPTAYTHKKFRFAPSINISYGYAF